MNYAFSILLNIIEPKFSHFFIDFNSKFQIFISNAILLHSNPQNMKKYFYFLLLLIVATSCTEDVKFNNPAFQGLKDNVFWRAVTYKAAVSIEGNFVVEGSLGYEKVTLQVNNIAEKTYVLGVNNVIKASYANTFPGKESAFSTGTKKGSGQIVITDFDAENNTISGTFKFNALNDNVTDLDNQKVTFTEGVFYKVPVTPRALY